VSLDGSPCSSAALRYTKHQADGSVSVLGILGWTGWESLEDLPFVLQLQLTECACTLQVTARDSELDVMLHESDLESFRLHGDTLQTELPFMQRVICVKYVTFSRKSVTFRNFLGKDCCLAICL
jgi:hypothetical protein